MKTAGIPVEEWDTLPLEVYDRVLVETKEHFEEYCLEAESITEKSLRLLSLSSTFIAGSGIYILSRDSNFSFNLMLLILSCLNFYFLFKLIKGRGHYYRGLPIDSMLNGEFDRIDLTSKEKIRLLYWNCIEKYVIKTEIFSKTISGRIADYNRSLAFTIILGLIISFYIGFLI